jgi:undecaprenyl diphosphate synthase
LKNKTRIHEADIRNHLWTAKVPNVDLIIRTGVHGDPHLSGNILLWQTSYSQLYFSELFWPDFNTIELKKAIVDYSKRERRIGK